MWLYEAFLPPPAGGNSHGGRRVLVVRNLITHGN